MAKKQRIQHFDDLDGSEILNVQPTVEFSLDGVSYEIDLHDEHQSELRESLSQFISRARRVNTVSTTRLDASQKTMKAWARANGYGIPEKGNVSQEVRQAFNKANN